ncbi:signal recognition particle-docking protein FtsY [archaeon]|nr:signal recognition particle-docking protein FtsY [Cryomorphaceae bacterium]MBT4352426.1 signal recognition particle-docking protein FtsY [archaeon]MBT4648667.1 signal recognition particle-docking protein FtsY [archaeon]MBT6821791.1 signal recognition particle-docking protein FtsY [archaeon]MBT7391186.1 signal recognition particle-docking protein FtsY [archaeon]
MEEEKKEVIGETKKDLEVKEEIEDIEEDKIEKEDLESIEEKKEEEIIEKVEDEKPQEPEKKSFFKKISDAVTKKSISESKFQEIFWDMELAMLENNMAVEVIEKIKEDLRENLVDQKHSRREISEVVLKSLKSSIEGLFDVDTIDLIKNAKKKNPYVVVFLGVNGAGKTTSIAKVTNLLKKNDLEVVIGACDTFRAAAIDQLEEHANKLDVKMIKQDYGSDAAAVAYDTVEHAKSKGKDVVLIDTAGRLHSNKNLMEELKKLIRVVKPDLKIFVGESITGNDCVEQVKQFNDAVGIDGIILSKADIDEKGGAAISVSYITGKPILYLGTGQEYDDLEVFDKDKIIRSIGL